MTTPEKTTTTPKKTTRGGKKEFGPSRAGAAVRNRLAGRYSETTPITEEPVDEQQPKISQTPASPLTQEPAVSTGVSQTPTSAAPDSGRPAKAKRQPKKTPTERAREVGMVTRSWYLPEAVADELAAVAGELAAGVPGVTKHVALSALIQAGLQHRDDVRAELIADLQRQLANVSQTPARR